MDRPVLTSSPNCAKCRGHGVINHVMPAPGETIKIGGQVSTMSIRTLCDCVEAGYLTECQVSLIRK